MIDLSKLDPSEAERIAHAEGFTGVAALYARLSDAEHLASAQANQLEDLRDTLYQCLPFVKVQAVNGLAYPLGHGTGGWGFGLF